MKATDETVVSDTVRQWLEECSPLALHCANKVKVAVCREKELGRKDILEYRDKYGYHLDELHESLSNWIRSKDKIFISENRMEMTYKPIKKISRKLFSVLVDEFFDCKKIRAPWVHIYSKQPMRLFLNNNKIGLF